MNQCIRTKTRSNGLKTIQVTTSVPYYPQKATDPAISLPHFSVCVCVLLTGLSWVCFSQNAGSARLDSPQWDSSDFPSGFFFFLLTFSHFLALQSLSNRLLFFYFIFSNFNFWQPSRSFSTALNYVSSLWIFQLPTFDFYDYVQLYVCICIYVFDSRLILGIEQHLDSPDNNPDLPWEFTDKNKGKVSEADNNKFLSFSYWF